MNANAIIPTLMCAFATSAAFASETLDASSDNAKLISFAQQRTNAVRITASPIRMMDRVATLCSTSAIQSAMKDADRNPHLEKYAHVFVSPQGESAMRTNTATFPIGTIVLKEKFSDSKGKKSELFTGMVKRESGYNPECGDWEFFTLSADANKVTSRGKLESCMSCHVDYRQSDFVTKSYAGW